MKECITWDKGGRIMYKISKKEFFQWLLVAPDRIIGNEIILKDGQIVEILDVSLGGGFMYIKQGAGLSWIEKENVGDEVVLKQDPNPMHNSLDKIKTLTAETIEGIKKEIRGVGETARRIHNFESKISKLENRYTDLEDSAGTQKLKFEEKISALEKTVASLKKEIQTSKTREEGGADKERKKEKRKRERNKEKSRIEPEEQTGVEEQPANVLGTAIGESDNKPVEEAGET
ncbi:MAG: hypothetical protein Q8S44_02895 [Flavobacteriaceae bacterium]|nr:hypothetical protein [Flavobacteriaceae bacterium]